MGKKHWHKQRCGKRAYADQQQAEKGLEEVRVLNIAKAQAKKNKGLRAYYCPICDAWHIGHEQYHQ